MNTVSQQVGYRNCISTDKNREGIMEGMMAISVKGIMEKVEHKFINTI